MFGFEVELRGGRRVPVQLVQRGTLWEALVDGRRHVLRLLGGGEAGRVLVELDGERLELPLEALGMLSVAHAALPAAASSGGRARPAGRVASPIAGVVQCVLVQPGQLVQRGDPLLRIEAMKMENTIAAPASGRVAALAVVERNTVLKGDLLVELEPVEGENA
jgi:biotin carboxyl carrier protein